MESYEPKLPLGLKNGELSPTDRFQRLKKKVYYIPDLTGNGSHRLRMSTFTFPIKKRTPTASIAFIGAGIMALVRIDSEGLRHRFSWTHKLHAHAPL